MDKTATIATTPTGKRQPRTLSVSEALRSSQADIRRVERVLFERDSYSPGGLLLGQLRLLLSRLEGGIAIKRDGALSLLEAACRIGNRARP